MIASTSPESAPILPPAAPLAPAGPPLRNLARGLAQRIAVASRPRSSRLHLLEGRSGTRVFLPNGSALHALEDHDAARLRCLLEDGKPDTARPGAEEALQAELERLGLHAPAAINDQPLVDPPLHALSLAIAQKCNLGCTYCYADQGDFGGPARNMTVDTARAAVDLLLDNLPRGSRAQLTFLGGEPLLNRSGLRDATEYASRRAAAREIQLGFALTSNGTLLRADDAAFFETHGFAVTISLDGPGATHDRLRPLKSGGGSFDRILGNIRPLLAAQQRMQVSARVTVTPANTDLAGTLATFLELGFHSVGFSPLLNSSSGRGEMTRDDLAAMLESMIECGLQFEQAVLAGRRFPFLNMINALREISRRTHRPYPCGAGAGYLGVAADGALAACHRFVNEPAGALGDLGTGIDQARRNEWLASRHVDRQEPCSSCWARYLCGGGCHHEVLSRGRQACDYIRGWLHYTLQAHERLNRLAPGWFAGRHQPATPGPAAP